MQPENWKTIEHSQVLLLNDAERLLLDKIQTKLVLRDEEFIHLNDRTQQGGAERYALGDGAPAQALEAK